LEYGHILYIGFVKSFYKTVTYEYDKANRLTKESKTNNAVTKDGETTGDKTITYAYDTNGNLICKGDDTEYESYTYTADNMLASATIHKGNTETVETYTYDGEGNRLRKMVKKKISVNEDEDGSSGNVNEEGENTTRRVGISDGEIVVFDETSKGVFHGHVRSWSELSEQIKAALRKAGMVNKKGKIL